MSALSLHTSLAIAALGVAVASAVIVRGTSHNETTASVVESAPTIDAFALARLLANAPADEIVIALDEPRHALRFAQPAAMFGATDDALVEGAPRTRRIVLVGFDLVRVDRVARRLRASGRDVRVLAGGLESWDQTMDQDPPAPSPGDNASRWQTYKDQVALRHAFGDAQLAPATPVAAPIAPAAAPAGGAPKKREGC